RRSWGPGGDASGQGLRQPLRWRLRGNCAELSHLGEGVDDPPGLDDAAASEAGDEDLMVGDRFAGWCYAHVFALVGAGNRVATDDLVALRDQILDADVKVGVSAQEHREHLLR